MHLLVSQMVLISDLIRCKNLGRIHKLGANISRCRYLELLGATLKTISNHPTLNPHSLSTYILPLYPLVLSLSPSPP